MSLRRCVHLLWVLFLIPLLVACPTTPSPAVPDSDDVRIEVTSDRSFVFTQAGDTAELSAVVIREDGTVNENAVITFSSSNPEVVAVDANGVLTAQTDDIGSAVITLSSGSLDPVVVTAVIAELTPDTVYVEHDELIAFDPDSGQVTLTRNAKTETLQVGNVLLSGDRAGLLDRVTSISLQGDRVVAQTVPANLTEAFENLTVEAVGAELEYDAIINDQGVQLLNRDSRLVAQVSLRDMACKAGGSLVNIGFSGVTIQQRLNLTPRVDLDMQRRSIQRFDIYMDGLVQVTAAVGELTVSGGVKGKIECKIELRSIPLAFVPIVGPLGIGPTATPAVGFEVSAQYTLGSVKVNGPRVDKGVRALMGLGYTNTGGFRRISDFTELGDGVQFIGGDARLDQEFKVGIEPFFGADVGVAALLGPISLARFDFLGSKVMGGAEVTMTLPLSPRERDYKGPRWNFYVGAAADLNPLLDNINAVERVLTRIGIPGATGFTSLNLTLFEFKHILLESPDPTILATPSKVAVEETVSLQVSARGADNARAEFVAFKDGEDAAIDIAEVMTNAAGNASATWTPGEDEDGDYDITVLIHDGIFGALGFPYAPGTPAKVNVTTEVVLTIDPPGLPDGEVDVEYTFTLTAVRIPEGTTNVTFDWNFGDGTTGSRSESVTDGRASTTISNTYSAEGVYGLIAVVTDGAEQLAQRSAVITIGEPEEREEELDICDVWKAAQSGGYGATVDNWDISEIPTGATFDIDFDAYSIPDKYIIEYPAGSIVLDTGWRGSSFYDGNPRYPGGIAGPGRGQLLDIFSKAAIDSFRVTVIGGEPGTAWRYSIRCRVP